MTAPEDQRIGRTPGSPDQHMHGDTPPHPRSTGRHRPQGDHLPRAGLLSVVVVVIAMVAGSAGCSTLTDRIRGAGDVEPSVEVAYGSESERQVLDLYLPEGEGPFPTVVFIHGGGWDEGSKEGIPREVVGWTGDGYAVASMNYRYGVNSPHDAVAAVNHLIRNAADLGVDPDRLGVFGFSAGAHLAMHVATGDIPVLAAAGAGTPADLIRLVDERHLPDGFEADELASLAEVVVGCDPRECPEKARAVSPAHRVTPGMPPVLLVHGTADEVVPVDQSTHFADVVTASGGTALLELVEGGDHRSTLELDTVRAFFDRTLG